MPISCVHRLRAIGQHGVDSIVLRLESAQFLPGISETVQDDAAFRFQQHGGDREADGVVIDGEDASGSGGRPGMHVGTVLHTDCDRFTVHLRGFNGLLAIGAVVSWA
jgi:hypothetical protein